MVIMILDTDVADAAVDLMSICGYEALAAPVCRGWRDADWFVFFVCMIAVERKRGVRVAQEDLLWNAGVTEESVQECPDTDRVKNHTEANNVKTIWEKDQLSECADVDPGQEASINK